LAYQLPVAIEARGIGLVVIDSIAANYRAESIAVTGADGGRRGQAKALAARSIDLIRTGSLLREIARKYNCAIVVANQVADRIEQRTQYVGFANDSLRRSSQRSDAGVESAPITVQSLNQENPVRPSPLSQDPQHPRSSPISFSNLSSSPLPTPHIFRAQPLPYFESGPPSPSMKDPRLALDHQLRFHTGWGDSDVFFGEGVEQSLKTPTLGLTWTNQISCRIALVRKEMASGASASLGSAPMMLPETNIGGADWSRRRWRRWAKLVFASWAPGVNEGDIGIEFEIWSGGVRSVTKQ
jgi:DNA repair protein RAD57